MATPGDHHDQHRTTRSVVALLVSVFCSSAASMAQAVALGKQVYDLTHSPFDLGLIGLVEFAPAALLVFVTGPIADRFDRRRVAAIGATGEMVTAAALALYAASRPTSVTPIFLLVTAFGVARAFGTPAVRSLPAFFRRVAGGVDRGTGDRRVPVRGPRVDAVRGGRRARGSERRHRARRRRSRVASRRCGGGE
jgi:MFS family permease